MRAVAFIITGLSLVACRGGTFPAPLRQSQQFTVIDARPASVTLPGVLTSGTGVKLVKLDADSLLLSAERVKETLFWELGYSTGGAGRIRMVLYPATTPDAIIGMITSRSPAGWDYRVEIPDQIDPEKLVRGVVHALLLEIANRGQGPRSAELPLWLVEGLTYHLLSMGGTDLVVRSVPLGSMLRVIRERRGLDVLQATRAALRTSGPLSFAQLAYPSATLLEGENLRVYQASAHLFVFELLRCKDGPAHLLRFLRELPSCWNWETALLRGFDGEFDRMLDVEKKWSVDVLAFTAQDPSQVWSKVLCLDRLDQILAVAAQVRTDADSLPERRTLSLQQVMTGWDLAAQAAVLREKLSLLEVLRVHAPPDVSSLLEGYHRAIASYLQKREAAARPPENRMQVAPSPVAIVRDAVEELERLDKRRSALRPENALSANSR